MHEIYYGHENLKSKAFAMVERQGRCIICSESVVEKWPEITMFKTILRVTIATSREVNKKIFML